MDVDRACSQWSIGNPRIKWGAVCSGAAVGLALQMVLTLAGLGIGAWAIDLHEEHPAEALPLGPVAWTGLSILISSFVGGYLAARLSGSPERGDGVYHGVVVWGVNWLVLACLTTTAMATMIGGTFSLLGSTLQSLGKESSQALFTANVSGSAGRVNLSVEDLRHEIESVLRATGKPELQIEEMPRNPGRALTKTRQDDPLSRITDQSLAELRDKLSTLDREGAVQIMMNRLGMSDAQARDVVQSTIGLLSAVQHTRRAARQQPNALGSEALHRLGMLSLWLSGLALISLAVSAIGGMMGTPDEALIESTTTTETYRDMRRAS